MGDTLGRSYLTRCPNCGSAVAPDTRPVRIKVDNEVFTMQRPENICPVCWADIDAYREAKLDLEHETEWNLG